MSPILIAICPICGKAALNVKINEETSEKERVCFECHYEHSVQISKNGTVNQETLCFLQFFGNSHKHVVTNPEIKTLADAEQKVKEIEQIHGIQLIEIAVNDRELGKTMVVSSKMPEV